MKPTILTISAAHLPHPVSAAAELEELHWLAAGDTPPSELAPLLRDHLLPLLWPVSTVV